MKKIGFTIGKYAPYHIGHKYLIETALKNMDEFYVVVYDTPELNIKMEEMHLRKWLPGTVHWNLYRLRAVRHFPAVQSC